jgi:hypothetical protein
MGDGGWKTHLVEAGAHQRLRSPRSSALKRAAWT